MTENVNILVTKNGCQAEQIQTSSYLIIYLKGDEFKFSGTLELKALAPILLKMAVEKMTK